MIECIYCRERHGKRFACDALIASASFRGCEQGQHLYGWSSCRTQIEPPIGTPCTRCGGAPYGEARSAREAMSADRTRRRPADWTPDTASPAVGADAIQTEGTQDGDA